MKAQQILKNIENVYCYNGQSFDSETYDKVQQLIKKCDSRESIFPGVVTRVHLSRKTIPNKNISGSLGCVIGSMFIPKDKTQVKYYQLDLAFRIYQLCIEFQKIGLSCNIITNISDPDKFTEESKQYHQMEFSSPLGVVFGYKSSTGSLRSRISEWLFNDSYRIPLNELIVNYSHVSKTLSEKVKDVLTASSYAFSISNTQTWRVYIESGKVHFYSVSDLEDKYYNLGFFLSAFDFSAKDIKYKGTWNNTDHPNIEGDYCISYL